MTDTPSRYFGQFRPEFSRLYKDRDLYWVSPFFAPVVLAVVGARFVGVGSTIDYLCTRYGFRRYALGAELRIIAEERGVPVVHRRYLQDLGDEVRTETEDPAFLARRVLRRIRADYLREPPWALPRSVVIGGLKTKEELEVISRMRNFKALKVNMEDDDLRFQRARDRGVLPEEYEADRCRSDARERTPERKPEWDQLSLAERRSYFDELDRIHADGHPGSWPEKFRGAPATVIAGLEDPLLLQNDFDSLRDLHRQIDRIEPEIRTAYQIVHH